MMNLMVLGGGGFIGSCVYSALKCRSQDGIFISRSFSKGYSWSDRRLKTVESSVDDIKKYNMHAKGVIDILYMANKPSLASFEDINTKNWTKGVEEVLNTLHTIAHEKDVRIRSVGLISSAGTVYGSSNEGRSTDSPLRPRSVYGLYHCLAESTVRFWCDREGIDYKIMRVTNPYGKFQLKADRKGLIVSLLETLKTGGCVELLGNGKQMRDYIYADYLGDAIIDVMHSEGSQIRNLSSGHSANGLEAVKMIIKATGREPIYKLSESEFKYEVGMNIVKPYVTETIAKRGGFKCLENGIQEVYRAMRNMREGI